MKVLRKNLSEKEELASAIGAIEISDEVSAVELPEEVIDEVLPILRRVRFKGQKVTVKRIG